MDDVAKIRREQKERLRRKREQRLKQREGERNKIDNAYESNHREDASRIILDGAESRKKLAEKSVRLAEDSSSFRKTRVVNTKGPYTVLCSSPARAACLESSMKMTVTEQKKPSKKPWEKIDLEEDTDDWGQGSKNISVTRKNAQMQRRKIEKQSAKVSIKDAYSDSDDDSDGLLRDARLLADKKRREKTNHTKHLSPTSSSAAHGSHVQRKRPGRTQKNFMDSSDEDDSDTDGLLRDRMSLDLKKKEINNTSQPSTRKDTVRAADRRVSDTRQLLNTPLPDLQAADQEEMQEDSIPTLLEPSSKVVASLWSDSEDEKPKNKTSTPRSDFAGSKRKRKRPESLIESRSPRKVGKENSERSRLSLDIENLESEEDDESDVNPDELRPYFANPRLGKAGELVPLALMYSGGERLVPAAINRYLQPYQREGVVFMHNRVAEGQGVILGDDMGLGKTVQVISLLAALLKKHGTSNDLLTLRQRQKIIQHRYEKIRKEQDHALLNCTFQKVDTKIEGLMIPKWVPILVVVPSSVIENWIAEFAQWGYFGVVKYQGGSRDRALERIRLGLDEVMVCGRSLFLNQGGADDLQQVIQIPWKLVVVDEYHQYKNCKTTSYKFLKTLKETCGAPLVGLTGTLMQNSHEELWSEVDLVNPGFLGTWEEFKLDTSVPIKLGRRKTADSTQIEESTEVREWLKSKLKSFYIQRLKEEVLKDALPQKDERVLFCELSPLQKRLYEHMMTLPDFVLIKYANAPCECGVNQAIFQGFRQMRTEAEKVAFQRANRAHIVPRKKCCHQRPLNPNRFNAGESFYDPRAPLWRWQHEGLVLGDEDDDCSKCPYCISFPALDKLYKLSSHIALLQVPKHPDELVKGSRPHLEAKKALDFATVALPDDVVENLPGGYIREDGIMNDHSSLSGKMKVLAELLVEFEKRNDRLLIFSFSTQMLDLIQNFVKAQGYTFLRLDGATPTKTRQGLVDKYQNDQNIFLFLISTKAGGLGLNLTAANVVIVFDVDFNPSNDEQSQDRAYRIGQKRDVLVIRLVSRGTVEELKYIRQIYKVQLKKDTIGTGKAVDEKVQEASRLFDGVIGDKHRKGELFGMDNLLKYKDGSFMEDLWKSSNGPKDSLNGLERFGLCSNSDIAGGLEGMAEDDVINIGGDIADEKFREVASEIPGIAGPAGVSQLLAGGNAKNHEDFLRADRGDAVYKPGDEGFDEQMGGMSQGVYYVLENADVSEVAQSDPEPTLPSPVVSRYRALDNGPSLVVASKVVQLDRGSRLLAAIPSPVRSAPQPKMLDTLVHSSVSCANPPLQVSRKASPKKLRSDSIVKSHEHPRLQVMGKTVAEHPKSNHEEKQLQPVLGSVRSSLTAKDLFLGKKSKKKKRKQSS